MSQHDFDVSRADANTGIAFRAAINAALQALASNNSGATAPTSPYAYMPWADTTARLLKIRNGANSAWVTMGSLDDPFLGLAMLAHTHIGGGQTKIVEDALTLSDNTTHNVSTSKHGLVPKAPNDTGKYLRGDGLWQTPPAFPTQLPPTDGDKSDVTVSNSGGDWAIKEGVVIGIKLPWMVASSDLIFAGPDGGPGEWGSPVKVAEWTCGRSGTLRVYVTFTTYAGGGGVVTPYGQVYRNGSPVGSAITSSGYIDTSGWTSGDLIQLYIWRSGGAGTVTVASSGVSLCGTDPIAFYKRM